MQNYDKIIAAQNDIFIFFEMIRITKPEKILDAGMFLKRIGADSRQAMGCRVPAETQLDGVDIQPEVCFPVFYKVYDRIYESFLEEELLQKEYDLISFLEVNRWLEPEIRYSVWDRLLPHTRYLLADSEDPEFVVYIKERYKCEEFPLGGKVFIMARIK